MIGREPDRTNTVIMIRCTNRDTRKDIEFRIRSSGLLDRYPGFGLSAAALPLETSPMSRLLGGREYYKSIPEEPPDDLKNRSTKIIRDPTETTNRDEKD